jgi:hypothetical protein
MCTRQELRMPTLDWKPSPPNPHCTCHGPRWEAHHGTTTLTAWHSPEDDPQWGWAILERNSTAEDTETSAASSLERAQAEAEARARDRKLIP